MTRLILAFGLGLLVAAAGCNKPSEEDCKKAINNIRTIKNFDPPSDSEMAAAVRTCRGNATKASVKCFVNATNAAELRECEGDIYEKMGGEVKPPAGDGSDDSGDEPGEKPAEPAEKPAGETEAAEPAGETEAAEPADGETAAPAGDEAAAPADEAAADGEESDQ